MDGKKPNNFSGQGGSRSHPPPSSRCTATFTACVLSLTPSHKLYASLPLISLLLAEFEADAKAKADISRLLSEREEEPSYQNSIPAMTTTMTTRKTMEDDEAEEPKPPVDSIDYADDEEERMTGRDVGTSIYTAASAAPRRVGVSLPHAVMRVLTSPAVRRRQQTNPVAPFAPRVSVSLGTCDPHLSLAALVDFTLHDIDIILTRSLSLLPRRAVALSKRTILRPIVAAATARRLHLSRWLRQRDLHAAGLDRHMGPTADCCPVA